MTENNKLKVHREKSFKLANLDIAASMYEYIEIDEVELEWVDKFLTMRAYEDKPSKKTKADFDKHWIVGKLLIKMPYSLTCRSSDDVQMKKNEDSNSLDLEIRLRDVIPEVNLLLNQIIAIVYDGSRDKILREIQSSVNIAIEEMLSTMKTGQISPFLCSLSLFKSKIDWLRRTDAKDFKPQHSVSNDCKQLRVSLSSQDSVSQLLGYFDNTAKYNLYVFTVGTFDPILLERYSKFLDGLISDGTKYMLFVGTEYSGKELDKISNNIRNQEIKIKKITIYSSKDKASPNGTDRISKEIEGMDRIDKAAVIISAFPKKLIKPLLQDCKQLLKCGVGSVDIVSTATIPLPAPIEDDDGSPTRKPRIIGFIMGQIEDFV